jgi:hypothetical protein
MTLHTALAAGAAVAAIGALEQPRAVIEVVETACPPALFALAMLVVESEDDFGRRWKAAGDDWVARGEILHDVVVWILTPEATHPPAVTT